MTAVNRLLALLGTRLPLIQAPMAGVQGAALAAAVCEAGALGSVPGATHTPDTLRAELTALRAATDRPWNVNFFCHTTPVFEPAREAAWRATLAPFHAEAGIDGSQVPPGAGRQPFSAALADALGEADGREQQMIDFPSAYVRYGESRRDHLRYYRQASRLLTPLFQSHSDTLAVLRDLALLLARYLLKVTGQSLPIEAKPTLWSKVKSVWGGSGGHDRRASRNLAS